MMVRNSTSGRNIKRFVLLLVCGLFAVAASCSRPLQFMHNQPAFRPLDKSEFFGDGQSARPLMPGTVARGHLFEDDHLYRGAVNGAYTNEFPFPMTKADLERGAQRYDIYCSMCHGFTGYGNGMIVQRGFSSPPSFHTNDVRSQSVGFYFNVVTYGYGAMSSYANMVPVEDRWKIVAYIRALQLSQNATINDIPPDKRAELDNISSEPSQETGEHKNP
ncbi:MAG: c-type cytochrome [Pyrinomonadaceae bacterium]